LGGITVNTLVAAFMTHAQDYYPARTGERSGEFENFKLAVRPLCRLYGDTDAEAFGPMALKTIRGEMVKPHTLKRLRIVTDPATGTRTKKLVEVQRPGWCRNYANRQISRIRQVFKWGVENELLSATVHHALSTVAGLKKGKGDVRESAPVKPAPDRDVAKVLPLLSPQVRAMVELEAITGMRPGEVRHMRTGNIDRSNAELWVYRPDHHKTEHHGDDHTREVFMGRRAQGIVSPFLKMDPTAYLFSPAEAERWRREQQRINRKTKVQPSQLLRSERAASRQRKRPFRDHYTKDSFNQAIKRACAKAGLRARARPWG
jgi:integrase